MPHGYHGRYLLFDLTAQTATPVPLSEAVLRSTLGGVGLGTWLLREHTQGRPDALDPAAPLVVTFSPLVGSPVTTSAKFSIVAKSPLTHRINDSLSSSQFAIAGKRTGYDAIVIVGKADDLSALVIEPDGARVERCTDCSGLPSEQTQQRLGRRLGNGFRIAAIGPAGENLVKFASISHDSRHAGRGGLGAVMGSRNLKAICVRGDWQVEFAHPEKLIEKSRELSRASHGEATAKYRELGTVSNLLTFNRLGTLPTRNFQQSSFEGTDELAVLTNLESTPDATISKVRDSCAACTIGCEHIFARENRPGVRMEYENLFSLGPLCGISDPNVVLDASALCDELGMDTISAGATIAFAMECGERGLIAERLPFGDGKLLLELLRKMAFREDIGDLLAEGTRAMASRIGQGSEQFAPHVKGLEIPGYEPRALQTMALGFAVNSRGADHNRSGAYQVDFHADHDRFAPDEAAIAAAIETENEAALFDSLILCKFLRGVLGDSPRERLPAMAQLMELVTGWEITTEELTATANRIIEEKKRYNISQGWTPVEDTLPARFFEPLPGGEVLSRERLGEMIGTYNRLRGWS